jgi:ankyrin repeat protein
MREAAERGQMGIVKALVEHGADVNGAECAPRRPPFSCALLVEHPKMFRFLLEHGAEVTGADGDVAAMKAEERGLEEMVALLSEQGVRNPLGVEE